MRTTPLRFAATAVLGAVLAAAPAATAAAAGSPTPGPSHEVGTVFTTNLHGLPYCPVGYGYVVIDGGEAVLVAGSGNFINDVLKPGQTVKDPDDGTLTFNKDGRSVTYNDYDDHGGRLVTETCKPHE